MAVQPKIRITATEYFQSAEYDQHDLIQLIDGEVLVSVPPIPRYQAIVSEILFIFMTIAKQKGGKAFTSPIEVYLDDHNVYEPDVLYLVPNTTCQVGEKRLTGAPDLVVEVLSPSTAKFDRLEKYQAYEQYGVREYWIVDPVYSVLEVWTLEDATFKRQGVYAREDRFQSHVLAEIVVVKDVFAESTTPG